MLPGKVYTDCKSVQTGVRQGCAWAEGARRRYSRLWSALHYDLDEGRQAECVHWIPAHTGADSVGNIACSDGETLTAAMRCANEMADMLAKKAAVGVAMSSSERRQLKARFEQAKDLAIFVGRLTLEAGAHTMPNGEVGRDSVGIDAAARSRKGKMRKKRAAKRRPVDRSAWALEQRSGKIAGVLQRIRSKMQGDR